MKIFFQTYSKFDQLNAILHAQLSAFLECRIFSCKEHYYNIIKTVAHDFFKDF